MKAKEAENRRLKRIYTDLSMQMICSRKLSEKKVDRPSQRREMAEMVVE